MLKGIIQIKSDHASDIEVNHPQPSGLQSLASPVLPAETIEESCYDIGNILVRSKSIDEICTSIDGLLKSFLHHVQPPNVLPSRFFWHGFNGRFQVSWLQKHSWLLYSVKLDCIFCGPCSLLLSSEKHKDKGQFVNKPFSNWIKISSALLDHSKLKYHHDYLQLVERGSILNSASQVKLMSLMLFNLQ